MDRLGYVKRVVGLVLLILGSSWLLLSVLNFTFTETVIDKAFVLEPGEWSGGWRLENRTWYRYRGFEVLKGKVSVEGGGINFTAGGDFRSAVERVFVDSYYNFTIDSPAGHFCAFGFDNTGGNATSYVKFVLNETSTESPTWRLMVRSSAGAKARATQVDWWIFSLLGSLVLLPIGFILTFGSLLSKKKARAQNRFSESEKAKADERNNVRFQLCRERALSLRSYSEGFFVVNGSEIGVELLHLFNKFFQGFMSGFPLSHVCVHRNSIQLT